MPGEMIRGIELPAPLAGERALYKRAISRSHAEWPLVEVCARAVVTDGAFQFIRLTAGGIAPVPLRLAAAEAALQGKPPTPLNIADAAKLAIIGRKAVADDGYKLDLLEGVVRDLLEKLARGWVERSPTILHYLYHRWASLALRPPYERSSSRHRDVRRETIATANHPEVCT